jgi:hypothetical protein
MSPELPHMAVYVRLGLSRINGIGVFAIRNIPKNTNIFANDRIEIIWVRRSDLDWENLSPAHRALYNDFGIARGEAIGCPVNFHNLTPGWYLNEPVAGSAPNVRVDSALNFFADRNIMENEELTVRYRDFSEPQ